MARLRRAGLTADAVFVFFLTVTSIVPYLQGLGFYGEDWSWLADFAMCEGQTSHPQWGCIRAGDTEGWSRPVQALERYLLYRSFGHHPHGYHIANSGIFCAAIVLFYLTLRELGFSRLTSVAVPSLYSCFPHYSTDRFWLTTAQANTSIAFCLLSFYAAARASAEDASHRWIWLVVSAFSMAASIFAYETPASLLMLAPLLLFWRWWGLFKNTYGRAPRYKHSLLLAAGCFLPVAAVAVVKYIAQPRIHVSFHMNFLRRLGPVMDNVFSTFINMNWSWYTYGLPVLAWRILRKGAGPLPIFAAGLACVAAGAYTWMLASHTDEDTAGPRRWLVLILAGGLIYGFAYAMYFPYGRFESGLAGIANRTTISMTFGSAIMAFAGLGLAASFLRSARWRNGVLASGIALLVGSGSLVYSNLGAYFPAASKQQELVLSEIRTRYPALPPGAVLLLDGVCPFVGPGIVFYGDDLGGVLRLLYHDRSLDGGVVNPEFEIHPDHVVAKGWGVTQSFPYSENLLLLRIGDPGVCQLRDAHTAASCIAARRTAHVGCPSGGERVRFPELLGQ